MITRVVRRVCEAQIAERVLVATDDQRIASLAEAAGAEVRLSTAAFRSGSDRVAAAVADLDLADSDTVLNVQGDEPLVDARVLKGALQALGWSDIGTVAVPADDELFADEDLVKVVVERGMATFARDGLDLPSDCQLLAHIGVYAFWAATLRRFAELPGTEAECRCRLEQLRALEHGMRIGCRILCAPLASVNRPEDIARVEGMILGKQETTWRTSEPRSSL